MMQTFGRWLQGRPQGDDWIGRLAEMAMRDRAFPLDGDVDQVRAHLSRHEAEAELFEVLEDAELQWRRAA